MSSAPPSAPRPPNPLPIRIGLVGYSSPLDPPHNHSAERRGREMFASLYVRGLHAHAYQHPELPAALDADFVQAAAA